MDVFMNFGALKYCDPVAQEADHVRCPAAQQLPETVLRPQSAVASRGGLHRCAYASGLHRCAYASELSLFVRMRRKRCAELHKTKRRKCYGNFVFNETHAQYRDNTQHARITPQP